MKFNICIIKPGSYSHSLAFLEIAELINFTLQELGIKSTITFNRVLPDAKNIIFGCHLLRPDQVGSIPKNSIIFNTEQLNGIEDNWNKNILDWGKIFEIWDYSAQNIAVLQKYNIENVKRFRFGFQKKLARIEKSKNPEIDLLFYGSVNERRSLILNQLINSGMKVKILFDVYGIERDRWIGNSKLIINHHYYNSQIFEIVRVFYLMTNSIAVVGEVNESTSIDEEYKTGFYNSPYEDLVSNCIKLVQNKEIRETIQSSALKTISSYPQASFLSDIL